MFDAGSLKWGEPTLGEPSGTITWSADFVDSLNIAPSFSQGDITSALSDAFNAWENVAAIDFQMVGSGGEVGVVAGSLASGIAGTAFFSYDGGSPIAEISAGEVTFNSNLTWSPYGGSGGVDFYAVALHEIGHILGLGHVDDVTEIMNATIFADDLGDGDIDGAQFLYGTDAGDPPPSPPPSDPPPDGTTDGGGGGGGGGAGFALLAGLLALILGLFSGGGGAVAALAAGRVSDDHNDDHDHDDEDGHDHDHYHGDTEAFHVAFLPPIPVDELERPNWPDDEEQDEAWLF